ncbi:MAG: hypothetical protein MHPSP_000630, partial [Paramarteilia canceri]
MRTSSSGDDVSPRETTMNHAASPTCHTLNQVDEICKWFSIDATPSERLNLLCKLSEMILPIELSFQHRFNTNLLSRDVDFMQE